MRVLVTWRSHKLSPNLSVTVFFQRAWPRIRFEWWPRPSYDYHRRVRFMSFGIKRPFVTWRFTPADDNFILETTRA